MPDESGHGRTAGVEALRELLREAPRDRDEMLAAIERRPALLTVEAEDAVGRLITVAARLEGSEPAYATHRRDLERLRRTLRDCRINGVEAIRRRLGEPQPAEAVQEMVRAAGLRDPAEIGQDPALLHWRESSLLLQLGRAEEAAEHLEAAARMLHARGGHRLEGDVELELSTLARGDRAQGDLAAAVRHAERAEAAYRRAGHHDGRRLALVILAVDTVMPGERVAGRTKNYLDRLAEVDAGYGEWFRHYVHGVQLIGTEPDAAIEELRRCADSVALLGDDARVQGHWRNECTRKIAFLAPGAAPIPEPVQGSAADLFLTALFTAGDEDATDSRLAEAIRLIEEERRHVRSEAAQRAISESRGPVYRLAAFRAHRAGRPAEAVDILERNTNRSLLARLTTSRLWAAGKPSSRSLSDLYQAQAIGYLTDAERRGWAGGSREQLLTSLRNLRESVVRDDQDLIRAAPPPHPRFEPASAAAVAARLAEDDVVLVYSPIGHIYRVTRAGVEHVADLRVSVVERLCADYRRLAADDSGHSGRDELDQAAARIAAACVDPVRSHLATGSRVLIVPYGALWTVPLAVLGPRPLAATHAVSYVPSLSMLAAMIEEPWRPRRVERFAGAGNPDGSLPYAVAELRRAAAHFYDATLQLGADSDMTGLLDDLPEADVIHFACHGIAFDEYPDLAALHLGGAGRDRRLLWAPDVVRLRLRARLVVLAACHAGLSTALPGNEYAGLPGVFLASGARLVLGPLWRVGDRVTATLMDNFYAGLAEAGPATALYRAQEAVRSEPATAHPYHWAAFQLFGLP